MLGTEIEYAVTGVDRDKQRISPSLLSRLLLQRAEQRPHLPGVERGLFLAANGARCLIEPAGEASFFEVASPETSTPFEAVRYELAGDRLVAQLAQEVSEFEPSISGIWVRKGGVDYLERKTWGAHENYLFSLRAPQEVHAALVSHCISRIVFAGAGGLDAAGRFVLSPRATFIRRVVDASTPGERALIDTRDEPHGSGYHRLHLMCGDHLRGHLANVLKLGTTALVVALADAGCLDPPAVQLARPLEALETINHDESLTRLVALADGRVLSALDLQRHYLQRVQDHLHLLPPWANDVCDLWAGVLDRLQEGPYGLSNCLEWALKWRLFQQHLTRRGGRCPLLLHDGRQDGSRVIMNRLAADVCALDLRFSQLWPPSLFDELSAEPSDGASMRRAGFHHAVAGVDEIDRAATEPPSVGRARVRAEVTRRLAGQTPAFTCTWDSVRSPLGRSRLDLSDPFAATEMWKDVPVPDIGLPDELREVLCYLELPASADAPRLRQLVERFSAGDAAALCGRSAHRAVEINNCALNLRDQGRLDEAESLLRIALAIDVTAAGRVRKIPHRRNNLATVFLMQGRLREACHELTLAWQSIGTRYDVTSARILTVRLCTAFVSGGALQPFVGQLKAHLQIQPLPDFSDVTAIWRADCILQALARNMDQADVEFLRHVVAVLNRENEVEELDRWTVWHESETSPLDLLWPTVDGALDRGERAPD